MPFLPRNPRSRGWRTLVAAFLFAAAAGLAPASVIPLTLEELTAVADEVVAVKVEQATPFVENGKIFTAARVAVIDSFKGDLRGVTEIVYPGGQVGPIGMKSGIGKELSAGEYAVLFLSYPVNRLTPEERSNLRSGARIISSPRLVGGFQGKFSIMSTPGQFEDKNVKTSDRALLDRATVVRGKASPDRGVAGLSSAPGASRRIDYRSFSATVRELVDQSANKRGAAANARTITGIRGTFHIPERRKDNAVARAFDPLPAAAYMTKQEIAAEREKLRQRFGTPEPAPAPKIDPVSGKAEAQSQGDIKTSEQDGRQ